MHAIWYCQLTHHWQQQAQHQAEPFIVRQLPWPFWHDSGAMLEQVLFTHFACRVVFVTFRYQVWHLLLKDVSVSAMMHFMSHHELIFTSREKSNVCSRQASLLQRTWWALCTVRFCCVDTHINMIYSVLCCKQLGGCFAPFPFADTHTHPCITILKLLAGKQPTLQK